MEFAALKPMEESILKNLNKIVKNFKAKLKEQKVGVFVSGGIDSSIIATLVFKNFKNVTLISLQTKYSKDKPYVELLRKFLKTKPVFYKLEKEEIEKAKPEIEKILKEKRIEPLKVHLPIATSFYFLCKKANDLGIKRALTGQGPDILFAGYHKYEKVPLDKLNEEIKKDLPLLEIDKSRDNAIAKIFGITLYNPYLEKEFVDLALKIPAEEKIRFLKGKRVEKWIMRKLGEQLGLPKEIVWRPKKAIQYSTGVSRIMQT